MRSLVALWLAWATVFITVLPPSKAMAMESDEKVLVDIVQGFFDAMEARDMDGLSRNVHPDAQYVSVRPGESGAVISMQSHASWVERLPTIEGTLLERMAEPAVLIDGDIAVVWTRYDFHLDGQFHHCGRNAFQFLRGDEGWQMISVNWTIEMEADESFPLGPPER